MSNTVILRHRGGRILEVELREDGSLLIHGQDFGSDVEAIFGRDEYEWYKTITVDDVPRLRRALGVPDEVELLDYLREHCTADFGHRFETVVRENELATNFWSSA